MDITLIYAEIRGVIGVDGKLPVHLKEDLQFFQRYTMGKVLVMGRKTVESLPTSLTGRTVVCLTKDKDYADERADLVMHSKKEILKWAEQEGLEELFIAGGGEVYSLFLKEANKIVKTRINHTLLPKKDFRKMEREQKITYSPDMLSKGEFESADLLEKTNQMVVVEYKFGGWAFL